MMWWLSPVLTVAIVAAAVWGTRRTLTNVEGRDLTRWAVADRVLRWWITAVILMGVQASTTHRDAPAGWIAAYNAIVGTVAFVVVVASVSAAVVQPGRRLHPMLLMPLWAGVAMIATVTAGYPSAFRALTVGSITGQQVMSATLLAGSWAGVLTLLIGLAHVRWLLLQKGNEKWRRNRRIKVPTRPTSTPVSSPDGRVVERFGSATSKPVATVTVKKHKPSPNNKKPANKKKRPANKKVVRA